MASNMKGDEPDKKFNEECSSSAECSPQGSHHSESTETLTAPKSRRSSSHGNCSPFVTIEGSDGRTGVLRESQLSHYYDLIEKRSIAQIMTRNHWQEPKKEMFLWNLKFPITTSSQKVQQETKTTKTVTRQKLLKNLILVIIKSAVTVLKVILLKIVGRIPLLTQS